MDPSEISVMAALITGIGALWKYVTGSIKDLKRRTDDCEKDRNQIHERLDRLGKELAVYKSCAADPCPARDGLRRAETFNRKPTP